MGLSCNIEEFIAEVRTNAAPDSNKRAPNQANIGDYIRCITHSSTARYTKTHGKRLKSVCLRLKDPQGDVLSEVNVPWPDGEPEPTKVEYIDVNECVKLTNNATFATVPVRMSKIREVMLNRQPARLPKRFSTFSSSPCPLNDSSQQKFHKALKEFVKDPLADGNWKHVVKYLHVKNVDADGYLTKEEQAVFLRFLPTQSFDSVELSGICEGLLKTNVFGPSCLASFYELCLYLGQTSVVQSLIESSDALSEQCLAVFLNFLADEENVEDNDDRLLALLLSRRFVVRRMSDAAARKITTRNASILLQRCMRLYVSSKCGDVAEQALDLISILIDTFGSRLVWENDVHCAIKKALDFSESMAEMMSSFNQLELKRIQFPRIQEEETAVLYKIEKISLPKRTLNW